MAKGKDTYTPAYRQPPSCLICGTALTVRPARGRKSGKPFIMLLCPVSGKHFRAFVNDQEFVRQVIDRLEAKP